MGVLQCVLAVLTWTVVSADLQSSKDASNHLESVLIQYDTLHTSHMTHVLTNHTPHTHTRLVTFSSLGREFKLQLKPIKRFSADFAAYIIDRQGNRNRVPVDQNEYYHGFVHGEERSRVTAHVSATGLMTAYIHTPADTYHVEPSSHYLPKPHPLHMIVYKGSQVRNRLKDARIDYSVGPSVSHSGGVSQSDPFLTKSPPSSSESVFNTGNRLKRQSADSLPGRISGTSCPIILVADHTVFELFKDRTSVISRLIQLVLAVDKEVYRSTRWLIDTDGSSIDNLGLDIREVMVHETANSEREHYNTAASPLEAGDLLGFMRFGNWNSFCLAHLFTNREFQSGLLGLAYIASSNAAQTGGVCSTRFMDNSFFPARSVIYNTGLTSLRNRGQQMVMSELVRVTGHELGHNWGSHHDPNTPECTDRWLMYEYAQDGSQGTHTMFSACSRASIGQVLLAKGSCLMASQPVCGDYRVEEGEECDVGRPTDSDPCCTRDCMLKPDSICSDKNSECCQSCGVAPTTVRCRVERNITFDCVTDTYCDGENVTCPAESPRAAENAPCINGYCAASGSCVPLCETINGTSCRCAGEDECLVCCEVSGTCEPASILFGNTTFLSNGASCGMNDGSVCVDGLCTRTTQDQITRIWNIIINLDVDSFRELLAENIVGCVLFLSIIVWCPVSCLIHICYDKEAWKRFKRSPTDETDLGLLYVERINAFRSLKSQDSHQHQEQTKPLLVPMKVVDEKEHAHSSPVDPPTIIHLNP